MKPLIILSFIFFGTFQPVFAQKEDGVTGNWLNEEKDARVSIYKSAGKYHGKIVWIRDAFEADGTTPVRDEMNPDPALRTRLIRDLVILTGFVWRDGEWVDGKVYDPKSGKIYSSKMKLKSDGLEIRGYIGTPLLGRTTHWTRVR